MYPKSNHKQQAIIWFILLLYFETACNDYMTKEQLGHYLLLCCTKACFHKLGLVVVQKGWRE